jgi:ubiquinone/menaquinone biosynthesis C-methylase UbiE
MATWNDLFLNKEFVNIAPQAVVHKFILNLQESHKMKEIKLWDLCCGTGRHTILASKLGCKTFASDISANGISHLNSWLKNEGLTAEVKEAYMIDDP